jgi:hypothetical protein
MERVSENDQPYEQHDKVENQNIVINIKSLQDMFRGMLENLEKKISETNQKVSETNQKLSDFQGNIEKKMSENNQNLQII